jgi:hypothetical protein
MDLNPEERKTAEMMKMFSSLSFLLGKKIVHNVFFNGGTKLPSNKKIKKIQHSIISTTVRAIKRFFPRTHTKLPFPTCWFYN